MYKNAVRIDPNFALALAQIAQGQGELGFMSESFEYWHKAVEALKQRHVTRREELRIRGLYASLTEDFVEAENLTHAWTLLYPLDSVGHHIRALALRNLDRLEDAREELHTSQKLWPDPRNLTNLVCVALLLGRPQEAASYLKTVEPPVATYFGGLVKFLNFEFEAAEADFTSALQNQDTRIRSMAYGAKACLLAELGRPREARNVLESGAVQDAAAADSAGRARKMLALAHLWLLDGQPDRTRALVLDAVRQYNETEILVRAGTMLARAGFRKDARELLNQLNSLYEGRRFETSRAILASEVAFAEGRRDQALAGFQAASQLAPPIHSREFLANAFDHTGRVEDALSFYRRIVGRPALIWFLSPIRYDPGAWTSALLRTSSLYLRLGRRQEARQSLDQFFRIRKTAEADDPQSGAARKLLSAV